MSYTVSEPVMNYLPSENIAWYSANSTDKNEDSFVYRFRLQLTDTTTAFTSGTTGADVIGTFRVPPRPVTGVGYFSPMAVAKTYVTTPLEYPSGLTAGVTGSGVKKFRIIYGQEYVTTSGATGMDSATGGTYYLWNSVLLDEDYPSYNEDTYVIGNYATATNTVFLTDGPSDRCLLTNDLLYALIGANTWTTARTLSQLINGSQNFFQTPSNFNYYDEVQPLNDSDPSYTWTTVGGQGIIPSASIGSGEYSLIVTYDQSSVYGDTYKLGPVYQGDEVTIYMLSTAPYSGVGTYNEMWLFGKNLSGNWVPITAFLEQSGASAKIEYYLEDYAMGQDYQQLGFAYADVGEANRPTIAQINTWTLNGGTPLSWEYNNASFVMPKRIPIPISDSQAWLTYLNTGSAGIGSTGYAQDVYIVNGFGTRLTEIITFDPTNCDNCSNCEKITLTWLNSLGGYDAYEFNCLSRKQLDVERVVGERTLTPGYVKGQRGRLNTSNVAKRSKVVSTNYETQTTVDWLESLFMSTDVYEVQSDGSFIPVVVDTNSYAQFVNQDKLKVVEFGYSLGYNRKAQTL